MLGSVRGCLGTGAVFWGTTFLLTKIVVLFFLLEELVLGFSFIWFSLTVAWVGSIVMAPIWLVVRAMLVSISWLGTLLVVSGIGKTMV